MFSLMVQITASLQIQNCQVIRLPPPASRTRCSFCILPFPTSHEIGQECDCLSALRSRTSSTSLWSTKLDWQAVGQL